MVSWCALPLPIASCGSPGLAWHPNEIQFCGIIELRTDELLVQKTDGNWINHDFFADFRFLVLKLWASV